MFIVCNYLDVEHKEHRTDGFVVEECSAFSEDLSQYVVVCREHRICDVFDWARSNMGDKFAMFEKQMSVNKTKAMTFVRVKGGIKSYTGELVNQAGDIDKFKEVYCKIDLEKETTSDESTSEEITSNEVPENEFVDTKPDNFSHFQEVAETTDFSGKTEYANEVDGYKLDEQSKRVQTIDITPSFCDTDTENDAKNGSCAYHESSNPMYENAHRCPGNCIYNNDGTFKGFNSGQIITMLEHLRELDNRIQLDQLNPQYVLTNDEFKQTLEYLDTISPSLFKAFILFEVKNAVEETDRIRMSGILDRFCTFVSDLNRGGC